MVHSPQAAHTHREAETPVLARPRIVKASKVAKHLTDELRKITWNTHDNPRYRYKNALGARMRGLLIKDPVANLIHDGKHIVINYAPFRDEGRILPLDVARNYLRWLQDGGNAPHWVFFEETGHVNL